MKSEVSQISGVVVFLSVQLDLLLGFLQLFVLWQQDTCTYIDGYSLSKF